MLFYTERTAYSWGSNSCNQTDNRSYGVNMVAYSAGYGTSCSNSGDTPAIRACRLRGEPFSYGVSDLAKAYIKANPGTLGDYSYLTLSPTVTVQKGGGVGQLYGYKYTSCGTVDRVGIATGSFKLDVPFTSVPSYQQKPPAGIFMLPPSVTRKMSGPLVRKALARSVAKAVPVVGYLSNIYDAARLAQALLGDAPEPNQLQAPAPPSGNLQLMLSSEPVTVLVPENQNNDRTMPGVTFIDTSIVTNNLYQVTQINWDSSGDVAEISDTMKWLLEALARAAAGVLDAFGREFPDAMAALADIISGVITDSQKAAGKILSDIAKEILGQLSDNGKDGLPDEPGTLDYDLLAQAIRDGVSEALTEYTPPVPPPSETVISVSESLEEKLDQYFTIPDTEAGLAETISTNGLIFNPGPMP